MKNICLILAVRFTQVILFLLPITVFSQNSFQKKISVSGVTLHGFYIQKVPAGGYAITGAPNICPMTFTGNPAYLLRMDSLGNVQWIKIYEVGSGAEQTPFVLSTQDGGFMLSGDNINSSAGDQDIYLLKLDGAGCVQWAKNYGGLLWDAAAHTIQTPDGGYVLTGFVKSFGAGSLDVLLMKVDASGNVLWAKAYGGTDYDYGNAVQMTSDGGFLILARAQSFVPSTPENSGQWLIKTDSAGTIQWSRIFEASSNDVGAFMEQTNDGGYIIPMYTFSYGGMTDAAMFKIDSAGNQQWMKLVKDMGGYELFYSAQQTSDNGFIFGGYKADISFSSSEMFMLKTDSAGTVQWTRIYGDSTYEEGWGVIEAGDGGFILVGESKIDSANCEMFIVKTNSSGISGCYESLVTPIIKDTLFSIIIPAPITTDITSLLTVTAVTPTVTNPAWTENILCYTGISETDKNEFELKTYPNPFSTQTTLWTAMQLNNATLSVYYIFGQTVAQIKNISGQTITLHRDNLPTGVYFLQLTQDNKIIATKKIIITD